MRKSSVREEYLFVDEAEVEVRGGKGGDGCVAFLREKHRPKGGPAGGDGGDGGNVVFAADDGVNTLLDFRRMRIIRAGDGKNGQGKNRSGAKGESVEVRVPTGTMVREKGSGDLICDLSENGMKLVAASGGTGGRGNQHFATPSNRAPRTAEDGLPGEQRPLKLELKLIADVGIIGLPNAGKSTLLAAVSDARPRIAEYPFTTKTPNLGIASVGRYERLVLADIPGLIEGAHLGTGLGTSFLRHIERTRILLHLFDAAPMDGSDPAGNVRIVRREIASYSEKLAHRAQILVANKLDLSGARENAAGVQRALGERVMEISAATRKGVQGLLFELLRLVQESADGPASAGT